jgi:hypothetical protein
VDLAIVRLDLDGAGNLVSETVIAKEGDVLPGQSRAVESLGTGAHQCAINSAAEVMFFADLEGDEATDGVIYRNGVVLAQEGGASPDSGRAWESLASFSLDQNDAGDWAIRGDLDGDPADDEVLVLNGAVFRREGDSVISIFTAVRYGPPDGPVELGNAGNILWFVRTTAPTTGERLLYINDLPSLIREDQTRVDGIRISRIATGAGSFVMSEENLWILFRGDLLGIGSGIFLVRPGPGPVSAPEIAGGGAVLRAQPNPFREVAEIRYVLDRETEVVLEAFDVSGRLVSTLDTGPRAAGSHVVSWSGRDRQGRSAAPGVYFLRLRAGDRVHHARMIKVD